LVKATGAEVLAYGKRLDKDNTITPDRAIGEGDTIEGTEFGLEVLHTPGHAPNHLCFLLEEERVLFTGDTVLDGMYSVIHPSRGGDMATYLATLARLEKLRLTRLCPGHGDVIEDPKARIQDYIAHRVEREKQILGFLKAGPLKIPELVELIYGGQELPPGLVEAAGWQVHAQLLKLKAEGKVTGSSVKSAWKLA
jgi:glyoxylase-like metal-dependent hydrolase (beta-lactamase superfamily II)